MSPAAAEVIIFHGKVVMANGTPAGASVGVEYACPGRNRQVVAITGKSGAYLWRYSGTAFESAMEAANGQAAALGAARALGDSSGLAITSGDSYGISGCILRAASSGYVSSTIDLTDHRIAKDPNLPDLVLARPAASEGLQITGVPEVPRASRKAWERGFKALEARQWDQAETELRAAATASPEFGLAWSALALACRNQGKAKEARDALDKATDLDPRNLATRFRLMRATMDVKDWPAAAEAAAALLKADTKRSYQQVWLDQAIIRFHLQQIDEAIEGANQGIKLDTRREFPRAEYILGLLYEAKRDYAAAAVHMRAYLELEPKASDAAEVRARIENLGKSAATDVAAALDASEIQLGSTGETWVPGGIKALAAFAGLKQGASFTAFFHEFCDALAVQAAPEDSQQIPQYNAGLREFMSAVVELSALGEHSESSSVITFSLAGRGPGRQRALRILQLLGWRATQVNGADLVEPGDQPVDGLRQRIPGALGIDEIAMKEALQAGRDFQFRIASENARLIGGAMWGTLLKNFGQEPPPGGIADAFTRDFRFAQSYAALSNMSTDAAAAAVGAIGIQNAVTQYSELLWLYSDAFQVSNGSVAVPGGPAAEPVWRALAGADPHSPPAFFRALIEKDHGDLLSYYALLSRASAPRQRFFTETPARAERFYAWYRDSGDVRQGRIRKSEAWHAAFFAEIPLGPDGRVRLPGGAAAWSPAGAVDESLPVAAWALPALVPIARFEEKRAAPLDADSVILLTAHYAEWRALLPYFEKLPGLGKPEFQALAAFSAAAAKAPQSARNTTIGQWHSIVELIALASQSGALDPTAAAGWFRRACEALSARDYSAAALALVREMAGGGPDPDESLARLVFGARPRASFDRVRASLRVPRIASVAAPDPAATLAALSGFVYAALLAPDQLLVVEDPGLPARHQFVNPREPNELFPPSVLVLAAGGEGSYFAGGFTRFDEEARRLARVPQSSEDALAAAPQAARPSTQAASQPQDQPTEALFRTSARLVEVYATVTDGDRYIDDIPREQFIVRERGKEQPVAAFESHAAGVSCALLLDTTGSMQAALPALKSTALKLIGELRPIDSIAVYGFSDSVTLLQPFTTDKNAASRAVLSARALGKTALYDALARVTHDLSGRGGKKVIVVFTDGADNMSSLTGDAAVRRSKAAGVPLYTIAQGDALADRNLVKQLENVSKATGAVSFTIRTPEEISEVFEHVARDLTHGYLLAFQPPPGEDNAWRPIEVTLRPSRGRKVRAREGYYPD